MKLKTLVAVAASTMLIAMGSAQAQVRPEVGKHLQAASALIKSGKYKEALAKVREADAVSGTTAAENQAIEGMRVAAASGAGEADEMVKGYESLKAAGKLGGAQQLQMMESIAGTYLRAGNGAKALDWSNKYFAAGGNSAGMKQVQTQAQLRSGDMGAVLKDTLADVQADEKAGRVPSRDKLNLLAYAADKKGDRAAGAMATEKLLAYYPSKELWAQILSELPRKKGFSQRFNLDVLRLKLATGNMRNAAEYEEMAQLAAAGGFPEEGKMVVDKAIASGALGQGDGAARAKRLSEFLAKKIGEAKAAEGEAVAAAKATRDGEGLVNLGLAKAFRGEAAAGVALIEEAISRDKLKRPDDAKLYVGLAWWVGGDTNKALAAWRGVKGTDGSGELARLWTIQARSSKK